MTVLLWWQLQPIGEPDPPPTDIEVAPVGGSPLMLASLTVEIE